MKLMVGVLAVMPCFAQTLTSADYARAEKFMGYNTTPLAARMTVRPNWLADDRFWYRVTTPEGSERVLVDPAKGTRELCERANGGCPAQEAAATPGGQARAGVLSPDGKSSAFIRDYNLWVSDVATAKETQLTSDGVKDYGYATDNAGW